MNLTTIKEQLLKIGEGIGLKVQNESTDSLELHTHFEAKNYFKNSIYLKILVYSSGTVHLFLTFSEIEKTYDNLFLINAFNSENPWFRAYITNINDKDYLELHYTAIAVEKEQSVSNIIGYLLGELLKENTYKYLKPIFESN